MQSIPLSSRTCVSNTLATCLVFPSDNASVSTIFIFPYASFADSKALRALILILALRGYE